MVEFIKLIFLHILPFTVLSYSKLNSKKRYYFYKKFIFSSRLHLYYLTDRFLKRAKEVNQSICYLVRPTYKLSDIRIKAIKVHTKFAYLLHFQFMMYSFQNIII